MSGDPTGPTQDVVDSIAYSAVVVSLVMVATLIVLGACFYVLKHLNRLRSLRNVRIILAVLLLCWMWSSLVADVSFWQVLQAIFGWLPSDNELEIVCEVYIVVNFGFVEPALLALVGAIFSYKQRGGAVTDWRPWRLLRLAIGLALLSALIQVKLSGFEALHPLYCRMSALR